MIRSAIRTVALITVACIAALVPSVAFANGPITTPQAIRSEGFEVKPFANMDTSWAMPTPGDPFPAYWGQVTQRRRSGGYGLWCAGAVPNSTTAGWTKFVGKYPVYTASLATMHVPELADYYSATLEYWYVMPSVGILDRDAFAVSWARSDSDMWSSQGTISNVSTMTRSAVSLTAPTPEGSWRPVNLSRVSGRVRFTFIDQVAGAQESEVPATGEGPSIDDVTVAGFKYGPVRYLSAAASGGEVTLNWTVPLASTALGSLPEARPITYRVWRAPDAQPYVWTELTQARTAATTWTDTEPLDGTSRYVVQVWDAGMGTGYGEVQAASMTAVSVIPPVPVTTIEAAGGVMIDGIYSEAPAILVSRNSAKGATYYRWDSQDPVATTSQSFTVPAREGTHTLEAWSVNSLGHAESPRKYLTVRVALSAPVPAPVTSIVASGIADARGTFTSTPTVTVSRDVVDGVTYYRWGSGSYAATTSALFSVPAMTGTHTLEAYSVAGGVQESPAVTKTISFVVPVIAPATRPTLGTPTLSTSTPRRYRTFYIRGTLKPSHTGSTVVKVPLYRYYSGKYRFVKTYTVTVPKGATTFSVKMSLSKRGTYRVKTQHACPLHISTYSSYKKFYVR